MSAPATLAYWDIRGLCQPIRYILEYTGMPWEDKYFITGPAPTFDKSSWLDVKYTLGLDFPNLPYFIDGPVKLTQSKAIIKYIARKYDLVGKTEEERIRADFIDSEGEDFQSAFVSLCSKPKAEFETMKVGYLEVLQAKLAAFSRFLGTNPWFSGQSLTYVDFNMYEILDQQTVLYPECLKPYQNLADFHERFEKLEKIATYRASPRFLKYPINNKMYQFGG